jgi:ABC-type transport system involved in multi-copper enzyme maturation permease subunit
LRLRSFWHLLAKEARELLASRSYWLLLLLIGPLVGHAFITAVNLYAEASGIGGGPAALPEALTPLDGFLVPTFGAYDIAATFFLPFVAIRLIAGEKQDGGLKLLLQLPGSLAEKITAKAIVLFAGWLVAFVPALLAIGLWKSYGGHLYAAETLNLILGHVLRALLSIGIAVAAASLTESAASAAIVTLAITVGGWALDFIAAGRGGWLQWLANYTPTASLRSFEQGLLRFSTTIVLLLIIVATFALAGIWLHTGRSFIRRVIMSFVLGVIVVALAFGATTVRRSLDLSENRRNSFSPADEAALRQIQDPLRITVILSPEDPRLTDFEQNVLTKLRRNLSHLDVIYTAGSQTGLFEGSEDHYGEIWYELRDQKTMERSTIEAVVLETIYKLANVNPPAQREANDFPGYPLAASPKWARAIFYAAWPLVTILAWWFFRREGN